jgi:hypothetical protein
MASSTQPKFRIDAAINDLLTNSAARPSEPPMPKGATLPQPVFLQHPEMLADSGPETLGREAWVPQGAGPRTPQPRIPDPKTERVWVHGVL